MLWILSSYKPGEGWAFQAISAQDYMSIASLNKSSYESSESV